MANVLGVMINHPEVYQAFDDQVIAPRFQQLTWMIRRAQTRGEVRQDLDADEMVGLISGPIWNHLLFDTRNTLLTSDLSEKLVDVILHGILASPPKGEGQRLPS